MRIDCRWSWQLDVDRNVDVPLPLVQLHRPESRPSLHTGLEGVEFLLLAPLSAPRRKCQCCYNVAKNDKDCIDWEIRVTGKDQSPLSLWYSTKERPFTVVVGYRHTCTFIVETCSVEGPCTEQFFGLRCRHRLALSCLRPPTSLHQTKHIQHSWTSRRIYT